MLSSNSVPIIIINWNGIEDTIECIESLQRMAVKTKFTIHLWDNSSEPNEIEKLLKFSKKIENTRLYLAPANIGFAKANNEVFEQIQANNDEIPSYVILLNNDTIVSRTWLDDIYTYAINNKADVVSSVMIDYYDRKTIDNLGHDLLSTGEIIPIGNKKNVSILKKLELQNSHFQNFGACGGAAIYKTAMLNSIGFFDPYFETGYEDAELGLRAKLAGYSCLISTNARVFHKGGSSITKVFNENYAITIQKNILYSFVKNYPLFLLLWTVFILLIRNSLLCIASILSIRIIFIRIIVKSWFQFLKQDLIPALKSRRISLSKISSYKLWLAQRSFLFFDLKRILNYLILRSKSSFEIYR